MSKDETENLARFIADSISADERGWQVCTLYSLEHGGKITMIKASVVQNIAKALEQHEAIKASVAQSIEKAIEDPVANCNGCGAPLKPENAWMEDGCPCNSPRGVNG